jgi:FAD/FMN-containing dehydrogenase
MVLSRFAGVRAYSVRECAAARDVAEALRLAEENDQPVAVRSGGHCFAGRSSTTGVVIDVRRMAGVEVDGDRAVIGAGTPLAEVYEQLGKHGRTIPAGCGATVGISGLTLGGGLGILGRRYGLTCDHLLAATMVLADGRVVEADDDLLWVLRGGGAPGVVTALTFRTFPISSSTAFRLTFPAAAASDIVDAWQAVAPDLDDRSAPSLVVRANSLAVEVTVFGTASSVDDLISRLGVRPSSDDRQHGSHLESKQWLSGDATDPRFAYLHSEFFRRPVPAADLVARLTADLRPGEERELDFTPWGGAYNSVPADATAFPHRDARFLLKQTATVAPYDRPGPWLDESYALTHPYGTGGAYPNFPEPDLPADAYYLANTARRAEIRARYDPSAVFDRSRRWPD